jgi:magnesium-transporting ATPase (P-type)
MTVQAIWTPAAQYAVSGPGRSLEGAIVQDAHQVQPWEGSALHYTLLGGVLDNEAGINVVDHALIAYGDPTEVALLVAGAKAGLHKESLLQRYARVDHVPFEPFRCFSASIYRSGAQELGFVKGAPERVLPMCDGWLTSTGQQPLDRPAVMQAAEQMAQQGLRVLAFAVATSGESMASVRNATPQHLTFVGLQGMLDPPRAEVMPAIAACKRAGIRVIMATGDHAATAAAIAQRVGLSDSVLEVRTGPQLEALSAEAFATTLRHVSVFSRVSPTQKLQIVNTLREQGQVVAVTGDGVNDAPALKAAHIGAAMGRSGTDVAREASDMVLADDNFATIYNAVEEGRTAFANIRKVTFFLLSSGVGQLLTLLASLVLRLPLPLLPTQILWMNMVTNGLQDVALAFEPGEPHLYRRPPRHPGEGILARVLLERLIIVGLVLATGTLLMFQVELSRGATLSYAQVTALTTLVMFQIFHVGNCRSDELSVLRRPPFANPLLLFGTLAALAVHIAAMHFAPTQLLIRLEPLSFDTWVRLCAVALSIVLVVELHKLIRRPPDLAFLADRERCG